MVLLLGRKEEEGGEGEEGGVSSPCLRWRLAWGRCSSRREEEGGEDEDEDEGEEEKEEEGLKN